jgi:hypothetical protein
MPTVPVYVNGARVEVPAGAPVLDAVRAWDADAAREVVSGARPLSDSRGLPLDPATPGAAGTIVRVGQARERGGAAGAEG